MSAREPLMPRGKTPEGLPIWCSFEAIVDPARLLEHPQNPNKHPTAQLEIGGKIIAANGWRSPVVVSLLSGRIVKGHGRRQIALRQGWTGVPVEYQPYETEQDELQDLIADNRLSELSEIDPKELQQILAQIEANEGNPEAFGFTSDELHQLLAALNPRDPDFAPPAPKIPVSKNGNLWLCGEHRLLVGDATNACDVLYLFEARRPHLMVTDPPYGVNYDPNWRNHADRANGKPIGARAIGRVQNDDRSSWREAWSYFTGDVAYVWHGSLFANDLIEAMAAERYEVRSQLIWAKNRHVISRGHYHWQHECCLYFVRKGRNARWCGDRSQTTLWQIDHFRSETGHGTQKPVACMQRPIENNSKPGDYVYDPFLGSGTSLIAAELTGRRALAIEIDPTYADVAVRRWEEFTGKEAINLATEKTLTAMRKERNIHDG